MCPNSLVTKLKAQAASLGFCALGIAPAQLEDDWAARLSDRPKPPYVPWDPEHRINPKAWLDGARSVLVSAFPYYHRYQRQFTPPSRDQGYFSPFARGPDYHSLVVEKLNMLGRYLITLRPDAKFVAQADNGPGCERIFALRAGVGWQGKNNFIIVPGHGSFVWLGLLTTDIELPRDKPLINRCGDCTECISACPTKAYSGPNEFHHSKCMAFWAGEKGDLSREQCSIMNEHKLIYGCDYCQLACPHNRLGQVDDGDWPLLNDLLTMSKAEFNDKYKGTAAGWRGHSVLKRNAVIAAGGNAKLRDQLIQLAKGEGLAARHARAMLQQFKENDE